MSHVENLKQDGRSVSQDPREYDIEICSANIKPHFSQPVFEIQRWGLYGGGEAIQVVRRKHEDIDIPT